MTTATSSGLYLFATWGLIEQLCWFDHCEPSSVPSWLTPQTSIKHVVNQQISMMSILGSVGEKYLCEGWKRKWRLDNMYSGKLCWANICIVMGLVCREERVDVEIRPVFFNIMVFEDKCFVEEYKSNLHKRHHVLPIVCPNHPHNTCHPCLYVNNRVKYM